MADGLNRVMLLGNLGADPELRFTQGGQAVLNIRVATTESYLDRDKVRRERTDWHSVVVWGKRGEALAKILGKGSSVFIEGSLRTSSYDDKEGHKRYKTEVVAQNLILTGRGGGGRTIVDEGGGGGGGGYEARGNGGDRRPQPDRSYGAPPAQDRAQDRNGPPPSTEAPADDFGYGSSGDDDIPF